MGSAKEDFEQEPKSEGLAEGCSSGVPEFVLNPEELSGESGDMIKPT